MNFLSSFWNRCKSCFVRENVQETAIVDENKEEETTSQNPKANPFDCYGVQKLIVKYADHWTLHNLREVSHDYKCISMRRQLHITRVRVIMGNHKLKLQVYDQTQRNWIWVEYENRGRRTMMRKGKEEELDNSKHYQNLFLSDFIRILKHRNTKLEELELDVDQTNLEDLKNNLPCRFPLQKKFKSMKGTIEVKNFSMTVYRYSQVGRGYRLANFLKLMKPGVLETIKLQFCGEKKEMDTQDGDERNEMGTEDTLDKHFSSIYRNEQWMQATHFDCQNKDYTPWTSWSSFRTVHFHKLGIYGVGWVLQVFAIDPPFQGCTITVDVPIDVNRVHEKIQILNIEAERADDNHYIVRFNDVQFVLVHIEELRIMAVVNYIDEN